MAQGSYVPVTEKGLQTGRQIRADDILLILQFLLRISLDLKQKCQTRCVGNV